MDFNSIEELYKYAQQAHEFTAENEVQETIKEVESDVIEEVVYSAYEPTTYERREDNKGLKSKENMIVKPPIKHGNTIEIELVNNTSLNPSDDGMNRYYRLDEVITYGGRYYEYPKKNRDEDEYSYLRPRPFTKKTEERLRMTKEHEKAYKNAMKAKGIDIK
ncbi:hypothetical protein ACY1J9_001224 [Clostridium botulinum]